MIDLDTWLEEENLSAPDLVKMDIEGAEVEALNGMRRILKSKRPMLAIEFHDGEKLSQGARLLRHHGYTLYGLGGSPLTEGELPAARRLPRSFLALCPSEFSHQGAIERLSHAGLGRFLRRAR